MLKKSTTLLLITVTLFFSACSSKKVFEPKNVNGSWKNSSESSSKIVDTNSEIAKLENGKLLTKDSVIDVDIKDNYRLLSSSDGWVISSTVDGKIDLVNISNTSIVKEFKLKKTIATASVQNDILAVLFADNEIALYSTLTKELLLKEQGNAPIAVDARIIKPYFMNDLIIFSTLDGKIVIVNSTTKKKLRTVIVSTKDVFNNIIYFNIINNKIVAATSNKILSLASKENRAKYEIRSIAYAGGNIYLATKQGELISLTPDLQLQAKLKFPFAHFVGMIAKDDRVYLLEQQGYIIEASSDLSEYAIYSADVENGLIFVGDKAFYVNDEIISVE